MNGDQPPRKPPGTDGPREGESAAEWFRRTFGEMPPPTEDMDAAAAPTANERRHDMLMALARTIPPAYAWARLSAPELEARVHPRAAITDTLPVLGASRLCLMGASRAGKTSLAVALLRRRVAASPIRAAFFAAHRIGLARIQHAAGHGEPEIVDRAMTVPLALLDDVGSERDTATNPLPDTVFERHAANLGTWVTTGLTREQLLQRYGSGFVTRLFDRAKVIRLTAKDPEGGGGLRHGEG
jgi:hypothetical protein